MALKFIVMPEDWEPKSQPQWYLDMLERERVFNSKHPRCIGCGRFVAKKARWNQCGDCKD